MNDKEKKPYEAPAVVLEIDLETRAGSIPQPPKNDTVIDF